MKCDVIKRPAWQSRVQDTSREADAVQVRLLRLATPERRGRLALMLSDTTRHLARRAIDRASPGLSEREKDLLFVRVHSGRKLARDLGRHLERHDPE